MARLTKEYQWALDRLRDELPRWEIMSEEFDWGCSLAVAGRLKGRSKNKRVLGFMLEVYGVHMDWMGHQWNKYSLNKSPKKRSVLNRIIKEFKKLETT